MKNIKSTVQINTEIVSYIENKM